MEKYLKIEKTIDGINLANLRISNVILIPVVTESYMEETAPYIDAEGNLTKVTTKITKITTITLTPKESVNNGKEEKSQ